MGLARYQQDGRSQAEVITKQVNLAVDPPWRPVQVFDDTRKVYIRFPAGISQGEMPPLFVIGPDGSTSELVNYRVRGATMIVDRLFPAAELRLGSDPQQVVHITRTDGQS